MKMVVGIILILFLVGCNIKEPIVENTGGCIKEKIIIDCPAIKQHYEKITEKDTYYIIPLTKDEWDKGNCSGQTINISC